MLVRRDGSKRMQFLFVKQKVYRRNTRSRTESDKLNYTSSVVATITRVSSEMSCVFGSKRASLLAVPKKNSDETDIRDNIIKSN